MNVKTVYEQVQYEIDTALLETALTRIESIPGQGTVDLVVADDLDSAIRKRLTGAEAENFSTGRISGTVGAKTLALENRGCAIVVNAKYLIPGIAAAAELDVPRVFEHEGWHAALIERREDARTSFKRLCLDGSRGHFLGQSVVIAEEFRVEKALAERGIRIEASSGLSIPEVLLEFERSLGSADSSLFQGDVRLAFDTVFGAFNALTTALSYLAADDIVFDDSSWLALEPAGWAKHVGDFWDELVDELTDLPSAAVPLDAERLDSYAEKLADLLDDWFEAIGYQLSDLPDGGLYFESL
jgi:hypothetical protein